MRISTASIAAAIALALAPAAVQAGAVPKQLAYVTGLTGTHPVVHVANADGSGAIALGSGAEALISPTGVEVAIATPLTTRGTSLVVRPARGGAARTLEPASEDLEQLAWSPDGTRLAVVVKSGRPFDTPPFRLDVIDVATGARHTIAAGSISGASFSPDSTRVAYAYARLESVRAPVDVYVAQADGSGARAITHDGRSLYPLWGPTRIAYTHEQLRRNDAPIYQLRTMRPDGTGVHQITHMRIPPLVSGLSPTAWSADGTRLLAEYGGQDTSEAWTVDVRSGRARDLTGRVDGVIGRGLSADGRTVLVQRGFFDDPAHQSVATIPFGGGITRVLVAHGSDPSWGG